jgi:hypothetical protein
MNALQVSKIVKQLAEMTKLNSLSLPITRVQKAIHIIADLIGTLETVDEREEVLSHLKKHQRYYLLDMCSPVHPPSKEQQL